MPNRCGISARDVFLVGGVLPPALVVAIPLVNRQREQSPPLSSRE